MALNQTQLKNAIKKAFKDSKAAGLKDPPESEEVILEMLSQDLALAIHNFVKSGEIVGVEVGTTATAGTFKQSNTGRIE
jgi:DNA-binding transcriptional regulator LsrR (DeoR family)